MIDDYEIDDKPKKESSTKAYKLCKWLDEARSCEAYRQWRKRSQLAYTEYLLGEKQIAAGEITKKTRSRLPLFWASIRNLIPAYFARTPETVARRMFDDEDPIARTACIVYERLSKSRLSKYPLDSGMSAAVLDFLVTDKGTARIFLEEEKATQIRDIPVVQTVEGMLINAETGEVVEGQPTQTEMGLVVQVEEEVVIAVHTEIQPVSYDDILHDPYAKNWQDIQKLGFRMFLSKHEFKEKFGAEMAANVSATKQRESDDAEFSDDNNQDNYGIEVWEIWCKRTKKVSYICKSYKDEVLLEIDDPYGLKDFFPCAPFIIGTKPPKNMWPIPMHTQLADVIEQLHRVFTRISGLAKALRRRGVADASLQELVDAINDADDLELIVTDKFQQLIEKKAIGDLIYYLPLQELSAAMVEAKQLLEDFKQLFFELSGVPDVVRGVTEAQETAASQQMKGNFYNVRTSWDQHQVQDMCRWLIEAQCDLALNKLSNELLMAEAGLQFLSPENQAYLPDAINLLRDVNQRNIRLEIETDSLTLMYQDHKRQERNLVVETVMSGLNQLQSMGQVNPAVVPIAMEMLLMSIRGVDLGKDYEASVEKVTQQIQQMFENPPQQAPPPPDYEGMKLQIAQQKAAIDQQKMEMDGIIRMRELDQKEMNLNVDANSQQLSDQLAIATHQLAQQKQALEEQNSYFSQQIEAQRLQLDKFLGMLTEREKLIEEARLEQQFIASISGADREAGQQVPQNVIINNVPPAPTPEPDVVVMPTVAPTEPEIF